MRSNAPKRPSHSSSAELLVDERSLEIPADDPAWPIFLSPHGPAERVATSRTFKGQSAPKSVFLSDLDSPFGMALIGSDLYIANTDALMRFHYTVGATVITEPGVKIADLPGLLLEPTVT